MNFIAANNGNREGAMAWIDTTERRDRAAEQETEMYHQLYDAEDDSRRTEWQEQFDSIPYRSNGADIHRIVMQRMGAMND
jgi:hypothetical protein